MAGTAGAAGKAPTEVHFTTVIPTPDHGSYFEGSIESTKKACANKRKVVVLRRKAGKDERVGATESEPRGNLGYQWVLESSEGLKDSKYYAKAPATQECQGDRSPNVAPAPR